MEQDHDAQVQAQQAEHDAAVRAWEQRVHGWMGRGASELVASWGIPTHTLALPDRTSLLEYDWLGEVVLGSNDPSADERVQRAQATGGDWCRERFFTGADGKLARWTYEGGGTGCPMR